MSLWTLHEPEEGEESKVQDKSKVVVGGIISNVTREVYKNWYSRWHFITLEDLVGTVEVVVFPRQFDRQSKASWKKDRRVFVEGRGEH